MRFVLSTALEAGLSSLTIETNNLNIYSHLKKGRTKASSFGAIIFDVKHLAEQCHIISFSRVGRSGNKVAHNLSHLSRNYEEMRVWLEEASSETMSDVIADLSGAE